MQSKRRPKNAVSTKVANAEPAKKRGRKGSKRMYFDNALVEGLVIRYQEGGCTDLELRNEIMGHSHELIIQVMRTNNLQNIYPYRDQTAEADLFQAAWSEIERSLYKFDTKRGTKIFNLWTQVARASMLALIKREGRDRKNQGAYKNHLRRANKQQLSFGRFIQEVSEVCKDNSDHLKIIHALQEIQKNDEKPTEGLVAKLIERSGLSRVRVQKFIAQVRDRAQDFSDAPIHDTPPLRRSVSVTEYESEDEE